MEAAIISKLNDVFLFLGISDFFKALCFCGTSTMRVDGTKSTYCVPRRYKRFGPICIGATDYGIICLRGCVQRCKYRVAEIIMIFHLIVTGYRHFYTYRGVVCIWIRIEKWRWKVSSPSYSYRII